MTSCARCGGELRSDNAGGFCVRCLLQGALDLRPGPDLGEPPEHFPVRPFGDYELLEEIARGGMGVIYRARQKSLNRIVALKMIVSGPFASKQVVQRFRGEVSAAALLQHPNIVAIHEVGVHQDQHYFSMDYVQGQNLSQLGGTRPFAPKDAARYVKIAAEAIQYAHHQGILHRDLKPSNVLIDAATDQPRITDFGLAKRLNGESSLTMTGQVLGSPSFMPPEQAGGRGKVGRHSDVYGLGAILYYLLTLRAPFQAESLEAIVTQVLNEEPIPPRTLNRAVPRDLETICLKCLHKESARRYETARDLADELGRFLRDEPIKARPVGRFEKSWRWSRRKPALAMFGLATILLLLVVVIGAPAAIFHINRERRRAEQNLYDSDMSLAHQKWNESDVGRTLQLLQAHQPRSGDPDLRGFEWYFLKNRCEGIETRTFAGHAGPVTALALAPDGMRLATGGFGSPVQIWDTSTGKATRIITETNVLTLAFSPDNRLLAVGGMNEFSVWDLEAAAAIFRHEEVLAKFQVAFPTSENLLIVGKRGGLRHFGLNGGSTEIWNYTTRTRNRILPDCGGYIALGNRGRWLATGNARNTISIWDVNSGELIQSLNTGMPTAMALSPDGQTLATSNQSAVTFWNIRTGQSFGQLENQLAEVWTLAFSPNGRYLATGGTDQLVNLWDAATHQKWQGFVGHASEVVSLAFSADSQSLASGSKDKTARLWKMETSPVVTTVVSNVGWRHVFSKDGRWVAAAVKPDGVTIWDTRTLQMHAPPLDAISAVGFSADNCCLMTGGKDCFLRLFDAASGAAITTIPGKSLAAANLNTAVSPDRTLLAVGSDDGTLALYDTNTGAQLMIEAGAFASSIIQLDFSPDGKFLAVSGWEEQAGRLPSAKVWSMETHQKVRVLTGHGDTVLGVGFSPDGKMLITSGMDNGIRFWDTGTWKEKYPAVTQREIALSLAICPDGKTFASSSVGDNVTLWSMTTRRELISFKGPQHTQYIAFSPDAQTLGAFSWDGDLQLWRAPITK